MRRLKVGPNWRVVDKFVLWKHPSAGAVMDTPRGRFDELAEEDVVAAVRAAYREFTRGRK